MTERRTGRILSVSDTGPVQEVQRLAEVFPTGEGGLLGIAASPNYSTDRWVYVYYSTTVDNRVARLHLGERPQPILTGIRKSTFNNGGRIAFGPDGMLYVGTGDVVDARAPQDLFSFNGKILRITPDGDPAPGNPFPDSPVYSYGHRNVQGLAWDPWGRLYAAEFGDHRYDELNRVLPGRNYGWPYVEGARPTRSPRGRRRTRHCVGSPSSATRFTARSLPAGACCGSVSTGVSRLSCS